MVRKKDHLHFFGLCYVRSLGHVSSSMMSAREKSASGCNHPPQISHDTSVKLLTVVAGAIDSRSTASQPSDHKINQVAPITFRSLSHTGLSNGCIPAPTMSGCVSGGLFGHNLLDICPPILTTLSDHDNDNGFHLRVWEDVKPWGSGFRMIGSILEITNLGETYNGDRIIGLP